MKHILRSILIAAALVGLSSSAFAQAPTTPYAVGLRIYNWTRGSRTIQTYIYYPATGAAGGSIVTNAPVANGVFPICEVTHGSGGSPSAMLAVIRPLVEAGFIVPAPVFTNRSVSETYSGDLSKDVSQILTNTIALNGAGTPFTGKINTTMIGVSGYSMGGMTTNGLFTAWPDSRIKAAMAMACIRMGAPSPSVDANILFIHGDQDSTTVYSSARQSYSELPPTKAFLTYLGGTHSSYWSSSIWRNTTVDWMRWSLYNDTAARDRLASGAASSQTKWEIVEAGGGTSTTIQAENGLMEGGAFAEMTNLGYNGSAYVNFPTTGGTCTFYSVAGGSGGPYRLTIRNANGSGASRTGSLVVNGVSSSITFPATSNWTTWSTINVNISLNAGTANTIRIASTGQDLANVDEIVLTPIATPDTYQAESAALGGGAFLETTNAGYNGSGYVNFPTSGGTLTFNNVDGNGGGTKSLAIRYANGGPSSRTGTITVNGTTWNITYNPTGAWTTWGTLNVNITLSNSTTNTIHLASTGQDLGNIDQITVP